MGGDAALPRLHHSRVRGNFGFYTTIWDRALVSVEPAYVLAMSVFGFGAGAAMSAGRPARAYSPDPARPIHWASDG